jgi:hypothetical protein
MLNKTQEEEFFFILERENKKLEQIFKSIKLKTKDKKTKEIFNLVLSYYKDMSYFLKKKEYVKAFELENYVWGLLDALAIFKAIQIPANMQAWFKCDFDK